MVANEVFQQQKSAPRLSSPKYQKPMGARKYPITFLHGAGQFSKTWETTPDGREGFQNIFLRRKYSVHLLDQPRRGDAARSTVAMNVTPTTDHLSAWLSAKGLD